MHAKDVFKLVAKDLLEKKSIESISVAEIIEKSGYSRKCFYKHFKDKHDLVFQIFQDDNKKIWDNLDESQEGLYQAILGTLEYIQRNMIFYQNAFKYKEQNSLFSHMLSESVEMHQKAFLEGKSLKEDEKEQLFYAILFYSYGGLSITRDWVMSGMEKNPEEMAQVMYSMMPYIIKKQERK